jgi:signal transduction histidine kinase
VKVRNRLSVVAGLALALGLAVLCLAGNLLLAHTIGDFKTQRLNSRLEAQIASLTISHRHVRINSTINDRLLDNYAWIFVRGRLVEQPAESAPDLGRIARAMMRSGRSVERVAPGGILLGARPLRLGHTKARATPTVTVVAGVSIAQLETLRRDVLFGSIAIATLVMLVGAVAVRRALSAALAPVEQMTRDAEDWGAHDLDRRFDLGPPRDEITALAATLDHLLARIASSRRHEQRFAAEVAHELRTPLAAIRGEAELAAHTQQLDEARAALGAVEEHSSRMTATLDTLMAFARRERRQTEGGADLVAIAQSFAGVRVEVGAVVPRVEGDANLVRQILAPLVDNAARHARTEVSIEIVSRSGAVVATVRDDGPGVSPELGERVFLPGVRGDGAPDTGAGLGLPLAQRLARSVGGEISLGPGPGGCFVLTLPAQPED